MTPRVCHVRAYNPRTRHHHGHHFRHRCHMQRRALVQRLRNPRPATCNGSHWEIVPTAQTLIGRGPKWEQSGSLHVAKPRAAAITLASHRRALHHLGSTIPSKTCGVDSQAQTSFGSSPPSAAPVHRLRPCARADIPREKSMAYWPKPVILEFCYANTLAAPCWRQDVVACAGRDAS